MHVFDFAEGAVWWKEVKNRVGVIQPVCAMRRWHTAISTLRWLKGGGYHFGEFIAFRDINI